MSTPFYDLFSDATIPIALTAHTPTNAGTSWVNCASGTAVYTINPSGEVTQTATGALNINDMLANPSPSTPDYTVTGIFKNKTLPTAVYGIFARSTGAFNTGYRLILYPYGPEADFFVGNSYIATVSSTFGGNLAVPYTVQLQVTGNAIQISLSGGGGPSTVYNYTDAGNHYPATGSAGLSSGNQNDTSTTGLHWTSFKIDAAAAAGNLLWRKRRNK